MPEIEHNAAGELVHNWRGQIDFVIITIRDDEFRAVLKRFPPEQTVVGEREYNICRLKAFNHPTPYTIAVLRIPNQGTGEAQQAATDAINDLDPQWVIVVGIAGGLPSRDFTLGDVIISTQIIDMTVQASEEGGRRQFAPSGGRVAKQIEVIVANLAAREFALGNWNDSAALMFQRPEFNHRARMSGDSEYQEMLRATLDAHFGETKRTVPLFRDGAIISSDILVKDTELIEIWKTGARQFIAVEMEAAGVFRAARKRASDYPILTIRGISDIVGLQRDDRWTAYACHTVASFTKAFIAIGPIKPRKTPTVLPKATSRNYGELTLLRQRAADNKLLSAVLLEALSLAHSRRNREFEKWLRLEIEGYFPENPVAEAPVAVPAYRIVPVEWIDVFGQPIRFEDPEMEKNKKYGLRDGVAELEKHARSERTLIAPWPSLAQLLRNTFGIELGHLQFSPASYSGVLDRIKVRFLEWLRTLDETE